jgi:hypothetical protein
LSFSLWSIGRFARRAVIAPQQDERGFAAPTSQTEIISKVIAARVSFYCDCFTNSPFW